MHKIFQPLLLATAIVLTGCSAFHMYQPEVTQGNLFTQAQISQLKPGMSKGEVRFLLGSSILQNAFDENRWDYVYTLKKRGKIVENKRLTLNFRNDRLLSIKQL